MTDGTDISSIINKDEIRNENEDWFYKQFRQALNDRMTITEDKNKVQFSDSRRNSSSNKLKGHEI